MTVPAFGDLNGTIVEVAPVSIHGDIYYDVVLRPDPTKDHGVRVRVPNHLCARPPVAGDSVTVNFLLQQVNRVTFDA